MSLVSGNIGGFPCRFVDPCNIQQWHQYENCQFLLSLTARLNKKWGISCLLPIKLMQLMKHQIDDDHDNNYKEIKANECTCY